MKSVTPTPLFQHVKCHRRIIHAKLLMVTWLLFAGYVPSLPDGRHSDDKDR